MKKKQDWRKKSQERKKRNKKKNFLFIFKPQKLLINFKFI